MAELEPRSQTSNMAFHLSTRQPLDEHICNAERESQRRPYDTRITEKSPTSPHWLSLSVASFTRHVANVSG